jgi:hypothetical protein
MQQVASKTSAPTAVLVGGIGGALLVVGSFLTWATVSLNTAKFAQLLHVPQASIAAAGENFSVSVAGTKADGRYTLVLGIVVIVGAIIAFTQVGRRKIGGLIMLIGGAIGAVIPVLEIATKTSQINSAISGKSSALAQAGISGDVFKSLFSITWGIGLWICLVGGVVALVAGVLGLRATGMAMPRVMDMGAMPPPTPVGGDMGFGSPAMPAPTPTPTPTMPKPVPTEPTPPQSEPGTSQTGAPMPSSDEPGGDGTTTS